MHKVETAVVEQVLLQDLAELPLAGELLADGQRHAGLLPHHAQAGGILAAQRILDEERAVLLHLSAEVNGVRRIEAGMHVDTDLDLLTQLLADGAHPFDGTAQGAARLEQPLSPLDVVDGEAHELPSRLGARPAAGNEAVGIGSDDVGIACHFVSDAASQQLVDRDVQRLRLDVPEGDVDGAHGRGLHYPSREEGAAKHHLPEVLDAKRIGSGEIALERLPHLRHGGDAAADAGLAEPVDALVRFHFDEGVVAPPPSLTRTGLIAVIFIRLSPIVWIFLARPSGGYEAARDAAPLPFASPSGPVPPRSRRLISSRGNAGPGSILRSGAISS